MCRVLILDDDKRYAESLKLVVNEFEENTTTDIASTLNEALDCTIEALSNGKPYTVFIVDQRLRAEKDGIEAIKELKSTSPDSDAIMLTGYDEHDVGVRAYQAGAFRYLAKPVEEEELKFVLDALMKKRRENIENKWRKIFSEMMEKALHENGFHETAKVVIDHSLQLGFERAHLYWAPKQFGDQPRSIFFGIECGGEGCSSSFTKAEFHLRQLPVLNEQLQSSRDSISIPEGEIKIKLKKELERIGYYPPVNGMWILPLWSGAELLGVLFLDFWKTRKFLTGHESILLDFFTRQVAVTLEHASVYIAEQRASKEAAIINHIGRQVSTRAAIEDSTKLLEQIRVEASRQFDTSNFSIFHYDEELDTLNFELLYENGESQKGVSRAMKNGLEEFMLRQKHGVLANNVREFVRTNKLKVNAPIPAAWLGAPLQVGDKILGGVCIKSYRKDFEFTDYDKRMLRAVADQVAGAVQISNAKKGDDDDKERMKLLRDASAEMLRIALQDEDNFWLTVLTIATANFGLGFNRALLFLRQDNDEVFLGRAGIGTNNREEAVRHWKRDEKQKHNFKDFLKHLEDKSVRHTPFHEMVIGIKIQKDEIGTSLQESLQAGQMLSLATNSISESLPNWLISQFNLGDCAVLPIMSIQDALGFIIVDNKHNQTSLNPKALGSLQSLLYNAGLVKEILRQQEKSEDLLDANLEISGVSSHQSLKNTLDRICKTAYLVGQADWAIIHPFVKDKKPYQIDVKHVGHYGELRSATITELTNSNPHVGGISKHVLRKGELIVDDIDYHDPSIGRLKLSEHHFIKSEGVKALIGEAVKDPYTRNTLGILYLDYRKPRKFSDSDKHHARSLASLAAIAISNEREIAEIRQKRQFQLASEIAKAVGASLDLEETIGAILGNLRSSFGETQFCVLLYHKRLHALKFAPGALKYYKITNRELVKKDTFHLESDATIACRVARETLTKKEVRISNVVDVSKDADYLKLNPRVKSEFCISMLSSKNELLGVLALEREQLDAFSKQDIEVIKTVAMHISIAIERAQQKEDLEYKSLISARTSWAANMAHGINSEVFNIRSWAYLIRKNAESGSEIEVYAKSIEECADQLVSINPWSSRPPESVEINSFITETLYPVAESKGILVEFQHSAPTTMAVIRTAQFKNVLKLLTNNASKAMKKPEEKKILVSTRPTEDGKVEITFQDFGPGIEKKLHASAFRKPFTTKGIGGYGLLFARQMIEDMQGEIMLAPFKEGEGATFIIHLPATSHLSNQSEGQ